MIDPFFRPSDKFREVCRSSVTFSALAIFFSLYNVSASSLPFLSLNLDPGTASKVFKNVNLDGLFVLVSIFYYLQMLVLYITEYIDFIRPRELVLASAINKFDENREKKPSSQSRNASIQESLSFIHKINLVNSYIRLLIDLCLPTALFAVGVFRGSTNLWMFIMSTT